MVNRQVNRREKGGRGGFDYRPSDPKKLRERAERQGGAFDSYFKSGVDTFTPKVGENALRICPPTWKGHDHFGMEIWVHGYIGSDKSSYLCPKRMLGKKCPICEAAKAAIDAGEKDEGDDIKAKQRVIYWVIDREGDSDDPQVWSVSWTMDKDISGRCEKRSGKILELDNPWDGHDVTFRRTGQGLKTRYTSVEVDSDKTPLHDREKEVERILEFVKENPLDSILKYYSYEHLQGIIDGTTDEKDEDLDDKPKKRRGRDDDEDEDEKPRKGRSRDDDEDEDERPRRQRGRSRDEDEDEDDKPKKRRSRDDDEDEDEKPRGRRSRDDDEEDDKPKRRSRDDDEEDDDKPKKRRSRDEDEDPADDDDDNGDDDKPKKRRGRDDDEEDDKPKKRRSRDDDEDEDDKPKKRRGRDEEEDDEIPSSRRAKRNRD